MSCYARQKFSAPSCFHLFILFSFSLGATYFPPSQESLLVSGWKRRREETRERASIGPSFGGEGRGERRKERGGGKKNIYKIRAHYYFFPYERTAWLGDWDDRATTRNRRSQTKAGRKQVSKRRRGDLTLRGL